MDGFLGPLDSCTDFGVSNFLSSDTLMRSCVCAQFQKKMGTLSLDIVKRFPLPKWSHGVQSFSGLWRQRRGKAM
ncbi:hypothetical protein BT93_I1709 [Corymbia citriodora subsp. variegata]|nr:hypothetical protein BT93_I1709 [Corymbia citriodora subsp. variegata]